MVDVIKLNWFVLLTFFMIFSPPILPINVKHVIGFFSIIFIIINWRHYRSFLYDKLTKRIFILFSILALYVLLIVLLNDTDVNLISYYVYVCVDLLPFSVVLASYIMSYNDDRIVYKIIIMCSMIELILIYLSCFIEPIQIYFVNLMADQFGDIFLKLADKRMFGFADSLTFSSAVIQAIIAWIFFMYNKKMNLFKVVLFVLFIIAGVMNARTTIVAFFIGLLVWFSHAKKSIYFKIISVLICGFLLTGICNYFMTEFEHNLTVIWISEGAEELVNFFQGETSTGYFSYATDLSKYALPWTLEERIFGTGTRVFGESNKFFSSDIGYVNDVWIGGYFFVIMSFGVYAYVFRILGNSKNDITAFLGRYMFILYPVINIKGQVYLISDITCLVIIILMVEILKRGCHEKTIN